jgi:hypothetical protein
MRLKRTRGLDDMFGVDAEFFHDFGARSAEAEAGSNDC